MRKCTITKHDLAADGWTINPDNEPSHFAEKKLPNRNPINSTPGDTDIKLVLHALYNSTTFAVELPNGALLNFVANSMEQLKAFENAITFYDAEY